MRTEVTRLDLRLRRRAVLGSALGMAIYTLLIVVIYPTFKDDTSLNALTKNGSTLAALLGATGSLTSVEGWLNSNLYANFVPLVAMLLTISYGANSIAGQDEDNLLGLTATLPLSRTHILIQKAGTLLVLSSVIPAVAFACILLGPQFELEPDWSSLVETSVAVSLLAFDLGLLAMLVGAATGSRGAAIGVASTAAASSYVISSLSSVIEGIRPLRGLSLFYWAVGSNQLVDGLRWYAGTILLLVGAALLAAAVKAFARLDVH